MASSNSFDPCQPSVLMVEDDPAVRRLMETVLMKTGFNVLSAGNGRTALEVCQQAPYPFDLLIADLGLPGLNGYDLAQRLKPEFPKMAILYTSGYLEGNLIECCKIDPNSQFLPKPFSPADLKASAHAALIGSGLNGLAQNCARFASSLAIPATVLA
jgi:CheY-like chemotaxis protein